MCKSTSQKLSSLCQDILSTTPDDNENTPQENLPKTINTRCLYASHWNLANWSTACSVFGSVSKMKRKKERSKMQIKNWSFSDAAAQLCIRTVTLTRGKTSSGTSPVLRVDIAHVLLLLLHKPKYRVGVILTVCCGMLLCLFQAQAGKSNVTLKNFHVCWVTCFRRSSKYV